MTNLNVTWARFSSIYFKLSVSNVACHWLITVCHQDLSQPVQASFSQSEEVFYRSHITNVFGLGLLLNSTQLLHSMR